MSRVSMQKLFTAMGWLLIAGGLVGSVLTYTFINSQEFIVALLARVVEQPFEYRTYFALLVAAGRRAGRVSHRRNLMLAWPKSCSRGNSNSRSAD